MKIDNKSLEFANQNIRNKPLHTPFYVPDIKYYKVGTPEEWLQFMEAITQVIKGQDIQDGDATYSLVKSLLKGGVLQVFKYKEESREIKDSPAFTKCLVAVTKHVFHKKAYKTKKKYI
eukprot:15185996-Ditylum_brightwellii.AAC.1